MKKTTATLVIVFLFVAAAKTNTSCATAESSQKHEVTVNISSPENRTYATTSVSLSFDWTQYVNENEIPRWIGYSIDEQQLVTVGNSTSASSYNTQLTNLVDGVHTLKVYVSGSLQTLYSVDVQFTVDTIHPDGTVLEPHKGIYIQADGSVQGTDRIHQEGNVYTLTENIDDSIVLEKDNIILDGKNYRLQGSGKGRGIELSDRQNVTIKNFEINNFETGIYIYDFSEPRNNTISGNTITNNGFGVYLTNSNNNTISGNHIKNNKHGIWLDKSSNNNIVENYIENNQNGTTIALSPFMPTSSDNIFYNNSYLNNTKHVYITPPGLAIPDSVNIWDNGVKGNYWSNCNYTDNNGDGINDTPYVINENNQDNYPLMEPIELITDTGNEEPSDFLIWIVLPVIIAAAVVAVLIYKKKLAKTPN